MKGIVLSLGLIWVSFSTIGCKNDAAASETPGATQSADGAETMKPTPATAAPKKTDVSKETADRAAETAAPTPQPAPAETATVEETEEKPAATPPVATTADDEIAAKTGETAPELVATEGVQLADLTVARGIEAKKPLDPRTTYTLGEYDRIVAFMSVLNPAETEDELHVSFLDTATGKERGNVSVRVGPQKKWRTWAYSKHINKAGKWEILVRNSEETVIGRAPFEILPAD